MAVSHTLFSNRLCYRILSSTIINIFFKYVHTSDLQKNEVDVFDSFTTQLLQKKSDRWENMQLMKKLNTNKLAVSSKTIINNELPKNVADYSTEKINEMFNKYLDVVDVEKLTIITNKCLEVKIFPSPDVLQKLLSFYAQRGDRDTIKRFQIIAEDLDLTLYNLHAKFLHYLAEATWIRGNIGESLKLFEEVYKDYKFLRRKLRQIIKSLIANVISERSEASLVLVINFSETIALKYEDYFPLACVWRACFLSEWYTDQCVAVDILDKHNKLCSQILSQIKMVVNVSLKNHRVEVVHRLFELLLKYEMKSQYTFVLQSLFNYRYWHRDLRSCAEIIQWSINLDVPLSTLQHEQLVTLLLNFNIKGSRPVFKNIKPAEDFKLKF